jgi:hypothetical protein
MIRLKPIIPKTMAAKFRQAPDAVQKGMREAAEAVKADFEKTTSGWKHQPEFSIDGDGMNFTISTDDEIYGYVDKGTRPHIIVAKNARVLRFETGGDIVFTPRVNHPGTKARLFTEQIAKSWRRGTAPYVRQALEEHFR